MPTVISGPPRAARNARGYVLRAAATGLGLFALFRLPWMETHIVLPLTQLQADAAVAALGTPAAPITVTLACSGTEVVAMCLGAVLAYPVRWRLRLLGAFLLTTAILALNTIRIGTLGLAAGHPWWFDVLHLFVWPVVLTLATAGLVWGWMRRADHGSGATLSLSWQFAGLATLLVAGSALTAPLYLDSAAVGWIGSAIAHAAATGLSAAGAAASASGNVLWTTRGGFSVTGDCVATPLLPLYLAAVWIYARTWPRVALGLLAAAQLLLLLGIIRLLLVALPQTFAASPTFATHAFYQVLLGAAAVVVVGYRRHGTPAAVWPVVIGLSAGVSAVILAGTFYTTLVMTPANRPFLDPQGAVAFLPSFQIGLYLALWIAAVRAARWPGPALGLLALVVTHVAGAWWLTAPATPTLLAAHIGLVRAWAVGGPLVILGVVVVHARTHR